MWRIVLCGAGLALIGCSTVNLSDAQKLSQTGSIFASSAEQNIIQVSTAVTAYVPRGELLASIQPCSDTKSVPNCGRPLSPELKRNVETIRDAFAARRGVFSDLSAAYKSLGDLTSYDSTAAYSESLTDLDGSLSNLGDALGTELPSFASDIDPISSLFGFFNAQAQREKVVEASQLLTPRLETLKDLMEKEKRLYSSLYGTSQRQLSDLTLVLWDTNILSAQPLIEEVGVAENFALVGEETLYTGKNKSLRPAILALAEQLAFQEQQTFIRSLDKSEKAISSLIAAHKKFEEDRPLNLQDIQMIAAELKAVADKF